MFDLGALATTTASAAKGVASVKHQATPSPPQGDSRDPARIRPAGDQKMACPCSAHEITSRGLSWCQCRSGSVPGTVPIWVHPRHHQILLPTTNMLVLGPAPNTTTVSGCLDDLLPSYSGAPRHQYRTKMSHLTFLLCNISYNC